MGSPCTFLPFFQWLATAESSPGCLTRGLESAAERLMDFRLIFPCFPGVFLKKNRKHTDFGGVYPFPTLEKFLRCIYQTKMSPLGHYWAVLLVLSKRIVTPMYSQ